MARGVTDMAALARRAKTLGAVMDKRAVDRAYDDLITVLTKAAQTAGGAPPAPAPAPAPVPAPAPIALPPTSAGEMATLLGLPMLAGGTLGAGIGHLTGPKKGRRRRTIQYGSAGAGAGLGGLVGAGFGDQHGYAGLGGLAGLGLGGLAGYGVGGLLTGRPSEDDGA